MILIKTENIEKFQTDSRLHKLVNIDNYPGLTGVDSVYETIEMTLGDMSDTALNQLTMLLYDQNVQKTDLKEPDVDTRDFEKYIAEFDKHYVARVQIEKNINDQYDL